MLISMAWWNVAVSSLACTECAIQLLLEEEKITVVNLQMSHCDCIGICLQILVGNFAFVIGNTVSVQGYHCRSYFLAFPRDNFKKDNKHAEYIIFILYASH